MLIVRLRAHSTPKGSASDANITDPPQFASADYCELAACRGVSFNFTLTDMSCGGVVAISAGRT